MNERKVALEQRSLSLYFITMLLLGLVFAALYTVLGPVWGKLSAARGPVGGAFVGVFQLGHLLAGGIIRRPGSVFLTSVLSTILQAVVFRDPQGIWVLLGWGVTQGLGAEIVLWPKNGYRQLNSLRMFMAGGVAAVCGQFFSLYVKHWPLDSAFGVSLVILFLSSGLESGLLAHMLCAPEWKTVTKLYISLWAITFVGFGMIIPTWRPGKDVWKLLELGSLVSYAVITGYYYILDSILPGWRYWRGHKGDTPPAGQLLGWLASIALGNLAAVIVAAVWLYRPGWYGWHLVLVSVMALLFLAYDSLRGEAEMARTIDVPSSFASLAVLLIFLYYRWVDLIPLPTMEPFVAGAVVAQISASAVLVQKREAMNR